MNKAKSWGVKKEQLFLLSRFPKFSGVVGSIIPQQDFNINDTSKTLGSYGLMTKENFQFISAFNLQTLIGNKASVNLNDFKNIDIERSFEKFEHRHFFPFEFRMDWSNRYCANTYEFVENFLGGNIGDITINEMTSFSNNPAKLLFDGILGNLKKIKKDKEKIMAFLNKYNDVNSNDTKTNPQDIDSEEGCSIIQARINFPESEN